MTQEKGRLFAEVKPKNIRKLFVPNMDIEKQQPFIDIAKSISLNQLDVEIGTNKIDSMLYSFYELSNEEIKMIESEF